LHTIARPERARYLQVMKTVLITGCSSGYGLETARHFYAQGWHVVATMRRPRRDALPVDERMKVLALDVTKPDSIAAALDASGPVDVLVNNAGIGAMGAFEAVPMDMVREIFETNTFGVMAMTQAVLPQMRARRSGVVVNLTSTVTMAPMPLVAVYTASKTAIEGFSASLALELEEFGVRVKLVEPGYGPGTSFTLNAGARAAQELIPEAYAPFARRVFAAMGQSAAVTTAGDVAEVVLRAATDPSGRLRFPAGADAVALDLARRSGAA
jgi:NAD(P)-dependent dehydrogenase (short-subunit alcohol dehydrogenase family)